MIYILHLDNLEIVYFFCSAAAERFFFAVISTAKEKTELSAYSASRAKRAVRNKDYDEEKNEQLV